MSVVFAIRHNNLERFIQLARDKKSPEGQEWIAYITIKGCIGSFGAGGLVEDYPVMVTHEGQVKMPLSCLAEAVVGKDTGLVQVRFEDGRMICGADGSCNDSIRLACGTDDLVLFPSPLEVMLLGRLLNDEAAKKVGLADRIPAAQSRLQREIEHAAGSLERYGVTQEDLKRVVESALARAEPGMRDGPYRWMIPSDSSSTEDQSAISEDLESLRALDELFRVAGQFSTRAEYADLLKFIARFRMYSPFNAMLVHTQMPGATYVATPKRWLQLYKRRILPGGRPITILQPKGPVLFVFDVSDTSPLPDAPALPQSVTNPFAIFSGKENGNLEKTIENSKRDGVRVTQHEFGSQHAGQIQTANTPDVFHLSEGPKTKERHVTVPVRYDLLLNSHQTREERYATLIHELGHLYCGHLGTQNPQQWPDRRGMSKQVVECEAESISYLVCTRLGIKTPSAEYLSGYLGEKGKMPLISVDTVVKVAGLIQQMGKSKLPLRKDPKEEKVV